MRLSHALCVVALSAGCALAAPPPREDLAPPPREDLAPPPREDLAPPAAVAPTTPPTSTALSPTRPATRPSPDEAFQLPDGASLVFRASDLIPRGRTMTDLGTEEARIIHEINRKRGTWQSYLLYARDDLPERLFHPGFIIRFPTPRTGEKASPTRPRSARAGDRIKPSARPGSPRSARPDSAR